MERDSKGELKRRVKHAAALAVHGEPHCSDAYR